MSPGFSPYNKPGVVSRNLQQLFLFYPKKYIISHHRRMVSLTAAAPDGSRIT
jgi:hypothetical protein